jgi:hypothetical protein
LALRSPEAAVMPTPMSAYYEAAHRFGAVDPADKIAVRKFFVEDFHKLSSRKKKAVMSFLLGREGTR